MESPPELNPAQEEVLAQLGASREERPRFDAALRHQLRRELEDGLEPLIAEIDPNDLMFVSKHLLGRVMGCERRFLAEDDEEFEWSGNVRPALGNNSASTSNDGYYRDIVVTEVAVRNMRLF